MPSFWGVRDPAHQPYYDRLFNKGENRMSCTPDKFRAWLDRASEESLDRGDTQAEWLEALKEMRELLQEEIATFEDAVRREEASTV